MIQDFAFECTEDQSSTVLTYPLHVIDYLVYRPLLGGTYTIASFLRQITSNVLLSLHHLSAFMMAFGTEFVVSHSRYKHNTYQAPLLILFLNIHAML